MAHVKILIFSLTSNHKRGTCGSNTFETMQRMSLNYFLETGTSCKTLGHRWRNCEHYNQRYGKQLGALHHIRGLSFRGRNSSIDSQNS